MENYDDMITSLSKRKHQAVGEYSIMTTLVSSIYNDRKWQIPYDLSKKEFQKQYLEIDNALTFYHKMCHCVHYFSTTNCILHFLTLSQKYNNTLLLFPNHKIKLPLNHFFNGIRNKIKIKSIHTYRQGHI